MAKKLYYTTTPQGVMKPYHEKFTCMLCNATMRPLIHANPSSEEEGRSIYCSSCKEDLRPYIDAFVEYTTIRAQQNAEEQEEVIEESEAEALKVVESIKTGGFI